MLSKVWVAMLSLSVLFGFFTGRISEVSAAAMKGATSAVTLCIALLGVMCLWSGIMELMQQGGLAAKIARCFQPLLRPMFGREIEDIQTRELISANLTANMLGLSNAATPIGLQAAEKLHQKSGEDALLTLMVLNATSLQLIPTTVAAVRATNGTDAPFAILPAVWCASGASVLAALVAIRIFRKIGKRK